MREFVVRGGGYLIPRRARVVEQVHRPIGYVLLRDAMRTVRSIRCLSAVSAVRRRAEDERVPDHSENRGELRAKVRGAAAGGVGRRDEHDPRRLVSQRGAAGRSCAAPQLMRSVRWHQRCEPTISRIFAPRRGADTKFYRHMSRLTGRALLARKESLREIGTEPAERRRRRGREPTRAVVVPRPQVARHPPRRSHVRVEPRPGGHRAKECAEGGEVEAGGEVGDGVVLGELEKDVEEREVDVSARPNARWTHDTQRRGAGGRRQWNRVEVQEYRRA